jgi:NAD(P)-dependent dehydrogenase (short-subunit alcohol dehydrogenase family)
MALDPLASFRLDGKVVIVTGASSGLGARFARVLDAVGASLVLVARRGDRLTTLADDLRDALPVEADIAAAGAADRVVDAALARFGSVDVLVNNAGAAHTASALDEAIENFQGVIDVNLVAAYALMQRCARVMVEAERGGSIVNVASIWGLVGIGQIPHASYAASKSALIGLTRELAAQWARRGVRVNALAPGWFPTEMTSGMFDNERSEEWIRRHTPMARAGREHELDGAILFLASDASTFVTGSTLVVDGGWTAI